MTYEIIPQPAAELDQLAGTINREYAEAEREAMTAQHIARSALEHAVVCGQALNQARQRVKHGQWLVWLRQHCPQISRKRANDYMRLAHSVDQGELQISASTQMSLNGALRLIGARPERAGSKSGYRMASGKAESDESWNPISETVAIINAILRLRHHLVNREQLDAVIDQVAERITDEQFPTVARVMGEWAETWRDLIEAQRAE